MTEDEAIDLLKKIGLSISPLETKASAITKIISHSREIVKY